MKVDNEVNVLPHSKVNINSVISVNYDKKKWVSRGAFKLLEAIKKFGLNFENKIVLDIGSSTGGFSQVALEYGAKKIYALDSGTNQLDYSLRINNKIVVMEKTNLKNITFEMFNEIMDIVVCDVSFISLKEVFKVLGNITNLKTKIFLLIKPQFEASSKYVDKGGFVDEKYHSFLIDKIKNFALNYNFKLMNLTKSPILGNKSKNQEYLSLFERFENG
nr:TlyA family RNA methyltransferase [[Mycoplasma] collis]